MWRTANADELKELTDVIGHGVSVMEVCGDRRFRVLSINARVELITGLNHARISGFFLEEYLSPAVAEKLINNYQICVDSAQPFEYEETGDFPSGPVSWKTVLKPITDEQGKVVRIVVSSTDMTSRHSAETALRQATKALHESESRLRAAVVGAEIGIWEWNLRSRTIWLSDYWAPSLRTFDGPASMSVEQWINSIHPDDRMPAIAAAERVIRGELPSYGIEWRFYREGRGWQWRHIYGTATEHDERGRPIRISGAFRDISQERKTQEELRKLNAELEYRAIHDSLTGTLNRGAIIDMLDKELARARREDSQVTVALIDADHFKEINDTYGHQVGDYTLQEMVTRIQGVLRPYDHLGRYGGEEFLVVAPAKNGIAGLHERIRAAVALKSFSTPAGELDITVSIGVAESDETTSDADELIRRADEALYRAKQEGRNRVVRMAQPLDMENVAPAPAPQ
ncbi:diguanylate cyclase [Proteobacteria bacterium 005FR1]|nr:diguanylate cyclase [Proteobacteria bacterium 005FR1]